MTHYMKNKLPVHFLFWLNQIQNQHISQKTKCFSGNVWNIGRNIHSRITCGSPGWWDREQHVKAASHMDLKHDQQAASPL